MKNFFKYFLMLTLIIAMSIPCFAADDYSAGSSEVEYTYFDDGSYFITFIEDEGTNWSTWSTTTETKSKTSTYYNSSDVALWYVKVTGTFTYGNGSATCTSSSITTGIYDSNWKITDKSASKSGATATAKATGKLYLNGAVVLSIPKTVNLTCDANGNFS